MGGLAIRNFADASAAGDVFYNGGVPYSSDGALLVSGISSSFEAFGASPSSTAAENVTAMQAAFTATNAAGGGSLSLTTPGTYLINDTLIVYSKTTIYLGPGVTVKMSPATNKSLLKNGNFDATKTSVTGNPTSSAKVISVTATAHGLAVGDYACLMGSTVGGYEGIFPVATVPTDNTLTLTADRVPDNATSSGTCFIRKADTNIVLSGPGVWDQDEVNQTFPVNNTELHAIRLQGVRNLRLDCITVQNARKYALHLITTQDVFIARPYFPVTESDGIHFEGMARNVFVTQVSGKTGDDAVAFSIMKASPAAGFAYTVPSNYHPGNVVDATVDGIDANTDQASFKFTGDAGYYAERVHVRNIGGSFKTACISIIDDTADLTGAVIKSMTFDGVRAVIDGAASGSVYQLTYNNTGSNGTIVIRDFVQDTSSLLTGGAAISGAGTIDRLVVDGYSTKAGAAVSVVGVLIGASTTINRMNVNNVRWVAGANASARFIHQSGAATIGLLQGSNWSISGDALGNGIYHAAGVMTTVQVNEVLVSGCRSVYENTTGATATPDVTITNAVLVSSAGQVVNLAQSTTLTLGNIRGASIGNNIIQIGATSKTFSIRASNFSGTLTQHMSYGTTNTINFWGDGTTHVDGTKLTVGTGTKGATFFNNAAGFETGEGLYSVSNAGAAVKLT